MKTINLLDKKNISSIILLLRYTYEPWSVELDLMTPKQRKIYFFKKFGFSIKNRKKFKNILKPSTVEDIVKI